MSTSLPAILAAGFGLGSLAFAVGWRWALPQYDERLAGDDIDARAFRDGVAGAFVAIGVGSILLGIGYLGTMRSLAASATTSGDAGPLVAVMDVIPLYSLGGVVFLGGFVLLIGSFLVPVGVELRERFGSD